MHIIPFRGLITFLPKSPDPPSRGPLDKVPFLEFGTLGFFLTLDVSLYIQGSSHEGTPHDGTRKFVVLPHVGLEHLPKPLPAVVSPAECLPREHESRND